MNESMLVNAAQYGVGLAAALGFVTARRSRTEGSGLLAGPRARLHRLLGRLRHLLAQAGRPHVPALTFVGFSAGLGALGGVLPTLFLGWPALGLVVGLAVDLLPLLVVAVRAEAHRAALLAAVPDGLASRSWAAAYSSSRSTTSASSSTTGVRATQPRYRSTGKHR